jgi:hypothetical protein
MALIISIPNMPGEISRLRFWEGVSAQIRAEDAVNAINRQFSFRFWPIKVALHVAAWVPTILFFFLLYPRLDSHEDTVVGLFDRACENRLYQRCSLNNISNCTGRSPTWQWYLMARIYGK